MKSTKIRSFFVLTTLLILANACGAPAAEPSEGQAPATEESSPVAEAAQPTDAPAAAVEAAPPTEAAVVPAIQHTDTPIGLPEINSGQATDFDSSNILEKGGVVGGDRFTFGRFERPFNANSMDVYYPELDIVNTEVYEEGIWIFGRLGIKELGATSSTSKYAVEIDTDLNGKADLLIVVDKPTSTEWTVTGVHVFQDANQNVGGEFPMLTDNVRPESDGFETQIFAQGEGINPDTAWVRISPNDPNVIEFAINRDVLSIPAKYLINFWAGRNINPAEFDLNDTYTHEQAGAADQGLSNFYPIKELAEIDNSCRMAVGFQVDGSEPGLCDVFIPQKVNSPSVAPSAPGAPVCVVRTCNGGIWNDAKCDCDYPK